MRALDALGAISGNLGIAGGGVSFYFRRRGAFHPDFAEAEPALPPRTDCLEPVLGAGGLGSDGSARARRLGDRPRIRYAMLPDSNTVAEALRTRELLVVADSFLTDTARLATLVLPTTTLLEADDLIGAYRPPFRRRRPARWCQPPRGPVERSRDRYKGSWRGASGSVRELAGDARAWKERFVAARLAPNGVTLDDLEKGATRNPLSPRVRFEGRKFQTASGKVNLLEEAAPAALGSDEEYPFTLMALSTEDAQSSQWSRAQEGPAIATVHPAAARGIPDGGVAQLESVASGR